MQRVAAVLMILCYAALGSGAMEYWHNLEHAAEDAIALKDSHDGGDDHDHSPLHDENNCPFHSQLHMAGLAVAWTPLLILVGLLVAFLSQLISIPLVLRPIYVRSCRGPPAH